MPEFKFSLQQRVTIKTGDLGAVEGVVSGCKMMVNQENEYDVHFLQPDLSLAHIVIPESVLADGQPKPNTIAMSLKIDTTGLDEAFEKARELKTLVKSAGSRPRSKRNTRKRR